MGRPITRRRLRCMGDNLMYRIKRLFSDGRSPKHIKVVATLELAQLHCNSPLTRGVLRSGVKWFDEFSEIKRKGK